MSASYAIGSFLGGELSQFAQGRFDKPDYRISLKTCLNSFPVEAGPWTRRPGTQYASHTRGGAQGRVIKFDFEQTAAITLEFTDGFLRFRSGTTLIATNDVQIVSDISAANPAVLATVSATTWATGNTLMFGNLGTGTPLLQNRQFVATKIDSSHFSLTDALTGASIDGSTLGARSPGATVSRLQELATPYTAGLWANIRPVQAETTDILLNGSVAPQAITVTTPPSLGVNPIFNFAAASFSDGPYLDVFTNGVLATPSATSGVITLTLSLAPWVSTTAYRAGDFVSSAAVNYQSLIDQNLGLTPAINPAAWLVVNAGAAINNGQGFLVTDIGRLIRLYSEPDPWSSTTSYASGTLVSFNPSGAQGGDVFYQSAINANLNNVPGTDATKWTLLPSSIRVAFWTWGKIVNWLGGASVDIELFGSTLQYLGAIRSWRLGAYSNTTGWPTCGTYHEGRLWLGGAIPNRFDACVSNGIIGASVNFAPTDALGVVSASGAISYTLNSDSVNPIFWMQPDLQGIILGTQAGEWLVQSPTTGPLSPTNIAARRVTKIGCANVEPRRTEHTTVFAQRYSQKLMEYFADVYSGKFSAPNLAEKAQHITREGISELAYQQAVTPIIWGRDTAGALFGITYKRDTLTTAQGPTFAAWHRHTLGSGRVVESICVGPSVGGNLDALTMVTNDTASGIRHVELLTDTMDELSLLRKAWFLDDAVAPTSTVSTSTPSGGAPYGGLTLNGLWHLNGKTVQVFAAGLDCGDRGSGSTGFTDFVVTNGSCFVPYGDSVSAGCGAGLFTAAYVNSISPFPIVVGFTYNSDGQLVRPMIQTDSGSRNGPAFAKLSRGHRYGMKLVNSLGLSVGGDLTAKLYPALFKTAGNRTLPGLTTFSGVHQDSMQDDFGYEGGTPAWRVSRPFPATVVIVGSNLSTQDQ